VSLPQAKPVSTGSMSPFTPAAAKASKLGMFAAWDIKAIMDYQKETMALVVDFPAIMVMLRQVEECNREQPCNNPKAGTELEQVVRP
jgi:hypothetical protein